MNLKSLVGIGLKAMQSAVPGGGFGVALLVSQIAIALGAKDLVRALAARIANGRPLPADSPTTPDVSKAETGQ